MLSRLAAIPHLSVSEHIPLSSLTRFGLGGPVTSLADASTEDALAAATEEVRGSRWTLIGGGTNVVAGDQGFQGTVLRYVGTEMTRDGNLIRVESGAPLQALVDFAIEQGLGGMESMTGIPGWVGGAVYGNAGAYGQSIHERIESVRYFDGEDFRDIDNSACEFAYRESIFKRQKNRVIVSALLRFEPADPRTLRTKADGILKIRNEKYPPTMRCAGSIFKNLLLRDLPADVRAELPTQVVREGKVPSAYFLEKAGAKGMRKGGIQVADYHANLIYNDAGGTSAEVRYIIEELKLRVENQFGVRLEEEVQYVG